MVPPPKVVRVPGDCDKQAQSGVAAPVGPPVGLQNGVTSQGLPDKAVGGHGPESGAVEVDVTCDPLDWSYSYSNTGRNCTNYNVTFCVASHPK